MMQRKNESINKVYKGSETFSMKYMGSKSRIAKFIVPIIQQYIDDNNTTQYIEPFVGGANVIDKIECKSKIGTDLNKYLIALLNRVQNDLPLYNEITRETYNLCRSYYHCEIYEPQFEDWEIGNIGFLASYNGRWFDGGYAKSGYEKTKNGERYRDYYREAKNNLLNQAANPLFKDCHFECMDYREYLNKNIEDALIYADPPYQNTKQYSNATKFDYLEFWECCREISKRNIVIISGLNAPPDFKCIWQHQVSRSIKATDERTETEKLFICNYK